MRAYEAEISLSWHIGTSQDFSIIRAAATTLGAPEAVLTAQQPAELFPPHQQTSAMGLNSDALATGSAESPKDD